jgi:hypothetical protein
VLVISFNEGQSIQNLRASLDRRISLAIHSLLLPVLVTELVTERSCFMILNSKCEIENVEHSTGHNAYQENKEVRLNDD